MIVFVCRRALRDRLKAEAEQTMFVGPAHWLRWGQRQVPRNATATAARGLVLATEMYRYCNWLPASAFLSRKMDRLTNKTQNGNTSRLQPK